MQNWVNLLTEIKWWPFILLIFIHKLSVGHLRPSQLDAVVIGKGHMAKE